MNLDEMYAHDGRYVVNLSPFFMVLVLIKNGVAHQLNAKGEKDGELSREAWTGEPRITRMPLYH